MKVEFEQIEPEKPYVVKVVCAECGEVLAESIEMSGDELKNSWTNLVMTKGFNTPRCPNKCQPTYSDFNINTKFEVYEVETVKV